MAVFAILGAFAGIGVTSIIVTALANQMPGAHGGDLLARSIPTLIIGAILGFGSGLAFALFLFKARPKTAQMTAEKKYIGRGGIGAISAGIPCFFIFLFLPWIGSLAHRFGNANAPCILFGMSMVFVGVYILFRDRIPQRWILPLVFWVGH